MKVIAAMSIYCFTCQQRIPPRLDGAITCSKIEKDPSILWLIRFVLASTITLNLKVFLYHFYFMYKESGKHNISPED